ncbi:MAG: hypothetical protein ABIK09_07350 [Pseudomonadota bacterium]
MRHLALAFVLAALFGGCRYDPPPEVTLVIPATNAFVKGELIRLEFSEPVKSASLEIRVWPGNKSYYDPEGELLPGYGAILEICTPVSSPCGDGAVRLTLDPGRDAASIKLIAEDALGPFGDPLRLEVTGALEDDAGNRRGVSTFYDFQIIEERWDPYADVVEPGDAGDVGDVGDVHVEPLGVTEGFHLFHAEFTSPIKLPQQFYSEVAIDQLSGSFIWVMMDADPLPDAPKNTDDPALLLPDYGDESFIFTVRGKIKRDAEDPAELVFDTEAFTLAQQIGMIYFELQGMVMHGRITVEDGRSRWDGTMAVAGIFLQVTGQEGTTYEAEQANFQIFELLEDEIPDDIPTVCEDDPCIHMGGKCDLLPDIDWPPESVCSD